MSSAVNTRRAERAAAGLNAYQRAVDEADCETAISDLIADLGHLAKKRSLDYKAILRRGIRAWAFEEQEPDGNGQSPQVRITIGTTRQKHSDLLAVKGGAK